MLPGDFKCAAVFKNCCWEWSHRVHIVLWFFLSTGWNKFPENPSLWDVAAHDSYLPNTIRLRYITRSVGRTKNTNEFCNDSTLPLKTARNQIQMHINTSLRCPSSARQHIWGNLCSYHNLCNNSKARLLSSRCDYHLDDRETMHRSKCWNYQSSGRSLVERQIHAPT